MPPDGLQISRRSCVDGRSVSNDNDGNPPIFILFETGSQDDGVLKIRVNGEDKYIQLYNLVS